MKSRFLIIVFGSRLMRYAIIDVPYSYGELSILLKDSCLTMPSWVYNTYALLVVDESGTYSK